MRMRFKPYARPELLACPFHVHEPLTHAGHWRELYPAPDHPFCLELGCGKGGFLAQIAPAHPENNYLGIDITDKVLILAKRKVERAYLGRNLAPDNVRIASLDIERLLGAFNAEDRVARIYINFCNPWSKNASSHKHRLTHPRQLLQYRALMDEMVQRCGAWRISGADIDKVVVAGESWDIYYMVGGGVSIAVVSASADLEFLSDPSEGMVSYVGM